MSNFEKMSVKSCCSTAELVGVNLKNYIENTCSLLSPLTGIKIQNRHPRVTRRSNENNDIEIANRFSTLKNIATFFPPLNYTQFSFGVYRQQYRTHASSEQLPKPWIEKSVFLCTYR